MRNLSLRQLLLSALFASLTAVCAQIAIPIGPVPINLATLCVLAAGAILGAKLGGLSQLVYVLLGTFGVPVFAFFSGGTAIITGPSGGFIVGYILAAFMVGAISDRKPLTKVRLLVALMAGALCYFTLGSLWFMHSTGASLRATLTACVIPFLPGDALKIVVVSRITPRLKSLL